MSTTATATPEPDDSNNGSSTTSTAVNGEPTAGNTNPTATTTTTTTTTTTATTTGITHRQPSGLRQKRRREGTEPLSELQPVNADLLQNPENKHPPLPPRRPTAPPGGYSDTTEPSDNNSDADPALTNPVDHHLGTNSKDAELNRKAFEYVMQQAREAEDLKLHPVDGHDENANLVVDAYLAKQKQEAKHRGIIDDEIYNEAGGYDTDDEQRIDELMEEDFGERQEKELKRLLKIAERRKKLRERQERHKNYRGMLNHPYNMDAVRRRLNGFSGVDSLYSSYQRHRFRNFRTLKPAPSFRYDEDGNVLRRAVVRLSSGVVYDGDLFDGKRHGRGIMTDADGTRYTGEFFQGEKHGFGVVDYGPLRVPDPNKGTHAFKVLKGQRYEGQFQKGKCSGQGKQWCGNELGEPPFDIYEGEFKDGAFHGHGKLQKINGEVYVGEWQKGYRHGSFSLLCCHFAETTYGHPSCYCTVSRLRRDNQS